MKSIGIKYYSPSDVISMLNGKYQLAIDYYTPGAEILLTRKVTSDKVKLNIVFATEIHLTKERITIIDRDGVLSPSRIEKYLRGK